MTTKTLLHITVRGRVQGIGYRFFVRETAESMGINGWVKNLPNGDVEIEAEGTDETLDVFLVRLREGHPYARIDGTDVERISSRKETPTEFRIIY